MSSYGSVYAIQQIAVSLAYSLGPIFGGEMAQYFGFYWLMIIVGTLNIIYGLMLLVLLGDWKSNVMSKIRPENLISIPKKISLSIDRIRSKPTKKSFWMSISRRIHINDFTTAWMYHKRRGTNEYDEWISIKSHLKRVYNKKKFHFQIHFPVQWTIINVYLYRTGVHISMNVVPDFSVFYNRPRERAFHFVVDIYLCIIFGDDNV